MNTLTHTYIQTYIHTYIQTYIHTYIQTFIHTYIGYTHLYMRDRPVDRSHHERVNLLPPRHGLPTTFRSPARVLLYAPSHRQDNTYHDLCYTSSEGRKEGNVLFNDALNTFYLRLYDVRLMVKDSSDIVKGNPLPPHRLLFTINSKGSFICTIPQTGLHIPRPCYNSRGVLAGTRNSSMGPAVKHWL